MHWTQGRARADADARSRLLQNVQDQSAPPQAIDGVDACEQHGRRGESHIALFGPHLGELASPGRASLDITTMDADRRSRDRRCIRMHKNSIRNIDSP